MTKILWVQLLKCEDWLLFLIFCDRKLNNWVLDCRLDKTSNLSMSTRALGLVILIESTKKKRKGKVQKAKNQQNTQYKANYL